MWLEKFRDLFGERMVWLVARAAEQGRRQALL